MKKLIFISSIVPDAEPYWNEAFTRSANNVFLGIANAFPQDLDVSLWSCQATPSFPKGPFWLKGGKATLDNGRTVNFLPTINIRFVKNIIWGCICIFKIVCWRIKHISGKCTILTYNNTVPPLESLRFASKLSGSRLYAILYDLGIPPKNLKLSKSVRLGYRYSEWKAKMTIKKIDGRIIINELIARDYAPGKDFLLIDGGVSEAVIKKLFPLKVNDNKQFVFVLAGMLWENNGTRIILDALKLNHSPQIKVIFAGRGQDVELIKEYSMEDSRVEYVGVLNMDDLFKLYERADALLNLRIEDEIDYHFPSKLLEYLTTGKLVVSTPIAHAERDYGQYLYMLHDISAKGLSDAWDSILQMDKKTLYENGKRQRNFMLQNRTWSTRTKEMLHYMKLDD